MIVVQDTFVPGSGGLRPLLDQLRGLRALWAEHHGDTHAGRLLTAFSGLPNQVIWQFECQTFGLYEEQRLAIEGMEAAQALWTNLDRLSAKMINNFYSFVGDDDTGAEVRKEGVVVQARYIPRHGQRDRTLELLRVWQRDWAAKLEPEMKGRVLGFTSTGVTHDILWQAEYPSAGAYEAAYGRWKASDAFEAWARDFRDSYVTNTHAVLRIVEW